MPATLIVTPQPALRHLKSAPGPPMTLGNAARAGVRLIVWCKRCHRQVESDPAEQAHWYGAEMPVPEWQLCCENLPREGRLRVMGWTPPDGICVPR
jgi:hypothetical protein